MKTLNFMVAIAASSTLFMASCGSKATKTDATVEELDDLIEENSVTVKVNSVTDTILNIDGKSVSFSEIDRIYNVDASGQFFMSVRAIVPAQSSAITNKLYHTIVDYFKVIADSSAVAPVSADNPTELAADLDVIGQQFVDYARQFATDTVTNGYLLNVDIRPVYGKDNYITYAVYADFYTGGAHGEVDTYFETFNTATAEAYDFDSMFSKDGQKVVREKLVDIIAKDKGQTVEEYLKSLNDFVMPDSPITVDNFPVYHVGVTSLGIVFTYPKYSIAAGYEGCPAYVIPVDELSSYLKL